MWCVHVGVGCSSTTPRDVLLFVDDVDPTLIVPPFVILRTLSLSIEQHLIVLRVKVVVRGFDSVRVELNGTVPRQRWNGVDRVVWAEEPVNT